MKCADPRFTTNSLESDPKIPIKWKEVVDSLIAKTTCIQELIKAPEISNKTGKTPIIEDTKDVQRLLNVLDVNLKIKVDAHNLVQDNFQEFQESAKKLDSQRATSTT